MISLKRKKMTSKLNAVFMMGLSFQFMTILNVTHCQQTNRTVYYMNINDTKECCSLDEYELSPIYCYPGSNKTLGDLFKSVTVDLTIVESWGRDIMTIYVGKDQSTVENHMTSSSLLTEWSWNKFTSHGSFYLNPFQPSCFGIETDVFRYKIKIQSYESDKLRLSIFVFGIALFLLSDKLSHIEHFRFGCFLVIAVINLSISLISQFMLFVAMIIHNINLFYNNFPYLKKLILVILFVIIGQNLVFKFFKLILSIYIMTNSTGVLLFITGVLLAIVWHIEWHIEWHSRFYLELVTDARNRPFITLALQIIGLAFVTLSNTYLLNELLILDGVIIFLYYR